MIAILFLQASLAAKPAAPLFESKYTSAKMEDCKGPDDDGEADSHGEPAEECPGIGSYFVMQNYSANYTYNEVNLKGNDKFGAMLSPDKGYGNNMPGTKIEWRLHQGQPFAAINRVTTCDDEPKKHCSEYLVVRGLLGHEKIHGDIDAKKPGANEAARALADDGFDLK